MCASFFMKPTPATRGAPAGARQHSPGARRSAARPRGPPIGRSLGGAERFAEQLRAAGREVIAPFSQPAAMAFALERPAGSCFEPPPDAPRVAVVGFMKNEAHVLREWLEHYFWQGADAVLLMDNGSTDDVASILNDFPRVEVISAPRRHSQERQYNEIAAPWLRLNNISVVIVVDLDEFLFSRDERSLQEVLLEFFFDPDRSEQAANAGGEPDAAAVFIHWSIFGSSGHENQPPTVREHFTWRNNATRALDWDFRNGKSVARVDMLKEIGIHRHTVEVGQTYVAGDRFSGEGLALCFEPKYDLKYGGKAALRWLGGPPLQLNHYPVQSRAFFEEVKMKRGAADVKENEKVRDLNYFRKYDFHESEDDLLKDYVAAARRGESRHPFFCATRADPALKLK